MQGTWENGQFVLAATKDSQIERLRAELICVCNLLAHRGRHAEDGKYCKICEVVARARKIAAAREGESEGEGEEA